MELRVKRKKRFVQYFKKKKDIFMYVTIMFYFMMLYEIR